MTRHLSSFFSDAAFEDSVATWGIVVIDPVSGRREVMGGKVDPSLVEFWMQDAGEQVITQAESICISFGTEMLRQALVR